MNVLEMPVKNSKDAEEPMGALAVGYVQPLPKKATLPASNVRAERVSYTNACIYVCMCMHVYVCARVCVCTYKCAHCMIHEHATHPSTY
jgi:hypothetical protein